MGTSSYVFVAQMFEEFQLSVGPLGKNRSAERLHDLLHSHSLTGELIFRGTGQGESAERPRVDHTEDPNQTRPKAPMPTGCRSVYLE